MNCIGLDQKTAKVSKNKIHTKNAKKNFDSKQKGLIYRELCKLYMVYQYLDLH